MLLVVVLLFVALSDFALGNGPASLPWELTLGGNLGIPTNWIESEFEFKKGPWAGSINVGSGATEFFTVHIEAGLFGRYYIPLGAGFDFYLDIGPAMMITLRPEAKWLIKAGPGFDYRWKHLRIAVEGGIQYIFGSQGAGYYVKGGLDYVF